MADEEKEDENLTAEDEDLAAEQFLILRGRYRYGGRNKTYGLLELIAADDDTKFSYTDLGSSSSEEVYELFLDVTNNEFRDSLAELVEIGNNQDRNISRSMRQNLSVPEIIDLLGKDSETEVKELIKEEIEDEVQEEIELEINWTFIEEDELLEIYPARFKDNEESREEGEEEIESLSDYEGGAGIDAGVKLNCSPVISAISGKLITSFEIGDEILVRITDSQKLDSELEDKIKVTNGLGVGTIEEIKYKEGTDRYNVLVELGDGVHGQLAVGPKVMLSYPEGEEDQMAEELAEVAEGNEDNNSALLFTIVALFIIIIILLLFFL